MTSDEVMEKQSGDFTRTQISLPKHLKRRMDRIQAQVNWSAIAVAAFEEVVAKIEKGGEVSRNLTVEQRLVVLESQMICILKKLY